MTPPAQIDVWTVSLDREGDWLPPTPPEAERAARLQTALLQRRFLRSHAALRAILATRTAAPLVFAAAAQGKPHLPDVPELQFNLSHSHELALVAVCCGVEVGVDVEWLRPLPACLKIAERFFPPGEFRLLADAPLAEREVEFFRRWTRIEAALKGRGVGLYGAGSEVDGWCVQPLDIGRGYVAAVAANTARVRARIMPFVP